MSYETAISPLQAATMADAVNALKENSMDKAKLVVEVTGRGAAKG